jgi:biotin carboxylase
MSARPVVIVGFVNGALAAMDFQADHTVIVIEEPDVIRKRGVLDKVAGSPVLREVIAWEFHRPGAADEFFAAHRDLDPAAVVPLTEYATPFAARLAERYGLPGAGYGAALLLRDKALLRQVTRAAGIANPPSVTVTGPDEVRAFLAAHGAPIVLKPANRQASVGTQVIRAAQEVEAAWAACTDQDEGVYVPDRPMEVRMLAEGFVAGPEFSVEMLLRDGIPLFANVTGKELFPGARPVERAHVVPADLSIAQADALVAQTRRVVAATGFRDGIVHCEWIVANDVPFLVECAGRFAGDGIVELIQRAYPVRLVRAYWAVMKDEPVPVALPDRAGGAAAVRFLGIEPGVIAGVHGVEAARAADGVVAVDVAVAPGDTFAGLRSSWDRVGDVMVTAGTPAEALRRAEAVAGLITVDVKALVPS